MNLIAGFQKWTFFLVIIMIINLDAMPRDVQGIWQKGVYQVDTISLADKVKAIWIAIAHAADISNHSAENANELLEHFFQQPKEKQRQGIFIYSKSYAIPDTPEEQRWMTEYLLNRNRNPEWRKSESSLVEDLQLACKKHGIPLYVNLSMNLQGKWRVLNEPNSSVLEQGTSTQKMENKKP